MNDHFCEMEAGVIRAARSGKWKPTLRTHLDSCAGCREAAKLVAAMNSLVLAEAAQIPPTPDPQRVWLKAQFAERQKWSARITQLAGFVYAMLAAAIGVGLVTMVKSSSEGIEALLPSSVLTTASIAPVLVVVGCILLAFLLSSVPARKSR